MSPTSEDGAEDAPRDRCGAVRLSGSLPGTHRRLLASMSKVPQRADAHYRADLPASATSDHHRHLMTYTRSSQSTSQKLGSQCSDASGCLTRRNQPHMTLITLICRTQNALPHCTGRRHHLPAIQPPGNLMVAEDQAAGIKPHSVDLGRRFSPIHFNSASPVHFPAHDALPAATLS